MILALAYLNGVRLPPAVSYGLIVGAVLAFAATAFRGIDLPWRGRMGSAGHGAAWRFRAIAQGSKTGHLRSIILVSRKCLVLTLSFASNRVYCCRTDFVDLIGPAGGPWAWAALLFALSLSAAALSYLFFEKPVTRALHRRLGKQPESDVLMTSICLRRMAYRLSSFLSWQTSAPHEKAPAAMSDRG